MKNKIFDNCLIQDTNGENVNRCSIKKANWYVSKNLANIIKNEPLIIQLNFEIKKINILQENLICEEKPNLCVVCGITENLTRHHILPYCFVKHMKHHEKINMQKDILGLCRNCHDLYEGHSHQKKIELSKLFGISINEHKKSCKNDRKMLVASSILLDENIPNQKKEQCKKLLFDQFGKNELSLDEIKNLKEKIKNKEKETVFFKIIMNKTQDKNAFAKEWREHFLATMEPRFMPDSWKVERNISIPNHQELES